MQIEDDIKLGFDDVLIRPKRSTMVSRSDVDLTRTIKFKHSPRTWTGIPIIAANMDTIGTQSMAIALQKHNMLTALHKFMDNDQLLSIFTNASLRNNVFYTMGITDDDMAKFVENRYKIIQSGLAEADGFPMICIDVANGYTQRFLDFIKKIRELSPYSIIMAGNVVTNEMTEEIILAGADIVKVGIGPGCFIPDSKIEIRTGIKFIQDVQIGDEIKTHLGNWQKITKLFKYKNDGVIIFVNDIGSTEKHEYYVLHKQYKNVVNDDNIHQYAEWIAANQLTSDYLLIKHSNQYK